jgi:hypothetical protein
MSFDWGQWGVKTLAQTPAAMLHIQFFERKKQRLISFFFSKKLSERNQVVFDRLNISMKNFVRASNY